VEPVFTFQFLSGDFLDHIQKLLRDQEFEFTEGLVLENRRYLFLFVRFALSKHQLSNLFEQRRGWVCQFSF
jgi:hypothetical protein